MSKRLHCRRPAYVSFIHLRLFFLLLALGLLASNEVYGQGFVLDLGITDGFTSANIRVGTAPDALAGFGAEDHKVPPLSPAGTFDVRTTQDLDIDIRPSSTGPHSFDIVLRHTVQQGRIATEFTLTWNQQALIGNGSFSLSDPLRGTSVDMTQTDQMVVPASISASIPALVTLTLSPDVLPVELVRFNAVEQDLTVQLTWATATETNNAGFYIERSRPNEPWQTIGFVEGVGTTLEQQNYRFTDPLPPAQTRVLKYRLKQVDFDGTIAYSPEVQVLLATPEETGLWPAYPNPFYGQTAIRYTLREAGQVTITVYDALGRHMKTVVNQVQEAGLHQATLSGAGLTPGVYLYQMQTPTFSAIRSMIVVR